MMNRTFNQAVRAGLVAIAVVAIGVGADAPLKSYDVSELAFQAPGQWKSVKPRSAMTQLQLVIASINEGEEPSVMSVSALRAGGGGVEANLKRWQMQFKDKDGNDAKVNSKTVKGKNVEITRVDIEGHYYPPSFLREPDRPSFRLLGAIVQTESTGYFFKLLGPQASVEAARPGFDQMLASIKATPAPAQGTNSEK